MTTRDIATLPCRVVSSADGLTTLEITMPSHLINSFILLMQSLTGLFQSVSWKERSDPDGIMTREKKRLVDNETRIKAFEMSVLETFDSYIKKGDNPRAALSLTASAVKYVYEFSSYDIIKNILTKNKRLKNTGGYKNNLTKSRLDTK